MMLLLSGCGSGENTGVDAGAAQTSGSAEDTEQTEGGQQDGDQGGSSDVQEPSGTVTEGTEEYRGLPWDMTDITIARTRLQSKRNICDLSERLF